MLPGLTLPASLLCLLDDLRPCFTGRPIVPAAFRKLDAVAVLTGPLLPAPLPAAGRLRRRRARRRAPHRSSVTEGPRSARTQHHGPEIALSRYPLYSTWKGILNRCENQTIGMSHAPGGPPAARAL
jgi:hypothetical protein